MCNFVRCFQLKLLSSSWRELFVLSLAQWNISIDMLIEMGEKTKYVHCMEQLEQTLRRFQTMDLDKTEYACLKAIVLFKPGRSKYAVFMQL